MRDYGYEEEKEAEWLEKARRTIDGGSNLLSPVCRFCTHLYNTFARTCAAFPRGIPTEIWEGENIHQSPYPGDFGIQFSPIDAAKSDE